MDSDYCLFSECYLLCWTGKKWAQPFFLLHALQKRVAPVPQQLWHEGDSLLEESTNTIMNSYADSYARACFQTEVFHDIEVHWMETGCSFNSPLYMRGLCLNHYTDCEFSDYKLISSTLEAKSYCFLQNLVILVKKVGFFFVFYFLVRRSNKHTEKKKQPLQPGLKPSTMYSFLK